MDHVVARIHSYQLKSGMWVPDYYLHEHDGASIKETHYYFPKGVEYKTKEEADNHARAAAANMLREKYPEGTNLGIEVK